MVGVVFMVGIMVLVMSDPAPLGYPADPTNTTFIPMPDWYFLFLYQLLKYAYTSDQFILFGTAILPAIAFGALLLAPFLDAGKERRFYRRPITSSLMILSLITISYLTVVSWHHYEEELKINNMIPETEKREAELMANASQGIKAPSNAQKNQVVAIVAEDDPGASVYKKATCVSCHATDLKGMSAAGIPALRGVGDQLSKADILNIIKNGKGAMPPQYQPNIAQGITDQQIDQLAGWLAMQKKQ
jgi:menaquinol-cytochrome c reductase cytochrome b/c subunit